MFHTNIRKILFAIFAVLVVSLSCGPPRFNPKGDDISDGMLQTLKNDHAGTYEIVEELENLSDGEKIENRCSPETSLQPGSQETLQFEGNQLTITGETGTRVYVYQEFGSFCRQLANGNIECLNVLDKQNFYLEVYESKNNLRKCFSEGLYVNQIAQPQVAESQSAEGIEGNDVEDSEQEEPAEEASDQVEENSPAEEDASLPISSACDATQHLFITSEITQQETNQFGTRLCSYQLKIYNNGDSVVWFYIHQHEKDGYQGTEKRQWMGNFPIDPGKDVEWQGNISIHTDEDFKGPVMSIPEKIAGIYGTPECETAKMNQKYLEQISVPINPVCPME
jgi:hypothetical protein